MQTKQIQSLVEKIRKGWSNVCREQPCPHYNYNVLGSGNWIKCDDCGATIDIDGLPGSVEASELFEECSDSILQLLDLMEKTTAEDKSSVVVHSQSPLVEMLAGMERDALRYRKLVDSGDFVPAVNRAGWGLRTHEQRASKADLDMAVDLIK